SVALLERPVALVGTVEPDSRSMAKALNNLGLVYRQQRRERDAVKVLERALAILVKNDGRHSGEVAPALMNLSLVHRELEELDIAERYGQEALAVAEALYPPNHPLISRTLDSLGQLAYERED